MKDFKLELARYYVKCSNEDNMTSPITFLLLLYTLKVISINEFITVKDNWIDIALSVRRSLYKKKKLSQE